MSEYAKPINTVADLDGFSPVVQIKVALNQVRFAMHDFDCSSVHEKHAKSIAIDEAARLHRSIVKQHLRVVS